MAGAGYKLFNTGDVLLASEVNTYLQQQTVMVFASSTARTTALSGVLAEGMISYLQDTNAVEKYDGTSWVSVGGAASPLTTKGDLYTYSTTDTRLAVGTNGHVLTADSSTAPGLKWAAPAGGGKVLQVIQDTLTSTFTATTGTPADSGLEVTITPSANTSKILIQYYFAARSFKSGSSNNNYGYYDLYDGTNVLQEYAFGVINFGASTDKYNDGTISGVYLDSPATTSARTYKIRVFTGDSTQMTVKAAATRIASIVAMEIGA